MIEIIKELIKIFIILKTNKNKEGIAKKVKKIEKKVEGIERNQKKLSNYQVKKNLGEEAKKNYETLIKMYKEDSDKAINMANKLSKLSKKALKGWEKGNEEIMEEVDRIIKEMKQKACPPCQKEFKRILQGDKKPKVK